MQTKMSDLSWYLLPGKGLYDNIYLKMFQSFRKKYQTDPFHSMLSVLQMVIEICLKHLDIMNKVETIGQEAIVVICWKFPLSGAWRRQNKAILLSAVAFLSLLHPLKDISSTQELYRIIVLRFFINWTETERSAYAVCNKEIGQYGF